MAADLQDDSIALLQQIVSGDGEAFSRFYDRYASLVFTFALRLLGSRADGEDLLQEVFLHVWRQAQSYNPERGSPEAWLITMTRSRAIDRVRSIRRRDMSPLSPDEPARLELWAFAGNEPVAAGIFEVDEAGRAYLRLPPLPKTTKRYGKFAVTVEPAGGVPTPTGPIHLAGSL